MFLKLDGNIVVNTSYIVSIYQKSEALEKDIINALEEGADPTEFDKLPTKTMSFIKMSDGSTVISEYKVDDIFKIIAEQEKSFNLGT